MEAFCRGCAAREPCGSCSPSAVPSTALHGSASGHSTTESPHSRGSSHSSLHPGQKVSLSSCFSCLLPLCLHLLGHSHWGGGGTGPVSCPSPAASFRDPDMSWGHSVMAQCDGRGLSCGSEGSLGSTGTAPRRVPIPREGHMGHCGAPTSGAFPRGPPWLCLCPVTGQELSLCCAEQGNPCSVGSCLLISSHPHSKASQIIIHSAQFVPGAPIPRPINIPFPIPAALTELYGSISTEALIRCLVP